jgi:hypothetical protein
MRNLVGIVAILSVIAASASAAEYWRFGLGIKGTAVIPGEDYSNALGMGVVAAFGDPESKFTTQLEMDTWKVAYDKDVAGDTLGPLEHQYSGLAFGIFEKYRIFNLSSRFSPYMVAGGGAYFLELKQEEETDIVGLQLRSQYLHSVFMAAGGLGIETGLGDHFSAFIEGRYVFIDSNRNEDKDLIQSYLGLSYRF